MKCPACGGRSRVLETGCFDGKTTHRRRTCTACMAKWSTAEVAVRDKKYSRERVRPSVRFAVLKRDGFKCRYCGAGGELHVDHVIPASKGGSNDPENLVAACVNCNLGKGART